jgi:glycosyltransferase involved in cell wall biosynthesis
MSHAESISYMYGSDVIISASRDDPFPVVLVEALCMGKICVVSDKTGVAELIDEGKNGFVFANENARALARKMAWITRNADRVSAIEAEARITYEKYLSLTLFEKKLMNYLDDIHESAPKVLKPKASLSTVSED